MTKRVNDPMFKEAGRVLTPMYCHDCDRNFTATLDYDLNGNHVIPCPHCGHEHCRVIQDGFVTGDRWDSRNGASGAVYQVVTATTSTAMWNTLTTQGSTTNTYFMQGLWNRTVSR